MDPESLEPEQYNAVKKAFLHCVAIASQAQRDEELSRFEREHPAIARQARELLGSVERGNAVERVLQLSSSASADDTQDSAPHSVPSDVLLKGHLAEEVGSKIGPYKLLEKIGEGGMGSVFMAQQTEPIKRRVAIKLIKPGMDSGQVVARFEAERQALALMDHPNIAKVLDAGKAALGRPYFAMELVRGVPISEYCLQKKLPTDAKLRLSIDVCSGVQHAHVKGIIHRDLKPSNVMITLHDGKPVVKIIDFGIAKAINQELTDKTPASVDGEVRILDSNTGEELIRLPRDSRSKTTGISWDSMGHKLAINDSDDMLTVWDSRFGHEIEATGIYSKYESRSKERLERREASDLSSRIFSMKNKGMHSQIVDVLTERIRNGKSRAPVACGFVDTQQSLFGTTPIYRSGDGPTTL